MPFITTDDGVKLAYEETGSGTPVVFVHEFAGDMASWEPQLPSGTYIYQLIAEPLDGSEQRIVESKKMILLR